MRYVRTTGNKGLDVTLDYLEKRIESLEAQIASLTEEAAAPSPYTSTAPNVPAAPEGIEVSSLDETTDPPFPASRIRIDTGNGFTITESGENADIALPNYSGGNVDLTGNVTFSSDTNLYRSSANNLKTDDSLRIVGDLTVEGASYLGGDTDRVKIDTNGHMVLEGAATVWDDLRVPVTSTNVGTANAPNFAKLRDNGAASQGVYTYLFDDTTQEELFFTVQLPHGWKEGTDIEPHVHWCPATTNTGVVRWGLEYTWVNRASAFPTTTLITGDSTIGSASQYVHTTADLPTISGSGKTISSMLICRVYRDAASGSDTLTGDAALLEVDFHIILDTLGSNEELVK